MAIKDVRRALLKANGRGLLPRYILIHRRQDVCNMTEKISSVTFGDEEDVFMGYVNETIPDIKSLPKTLSADNARTLLRCDRIAKDVLITLYETLATLTGRYVTINDDDHLPGDYTAADFDRLRKCVVLSQRLSECHMAFASDLGATTSYFYLKREEEHKHGPVLLHESHDLTQNIVAEYRNTVTEDGRRTMLDNSLCGIMDVLDNACHSIKDLEETVDNLRSENRMLRERLERMEAMMGMCYTTVQNMRLSYDDDEDDDE